MSKRSVARHVFGQLVSRADGTDLEAGALTVFVTKDGGARQSATNEEQAALLGDGLCVVYLTAEEMNAAVIAVQFVHSSGITHMREIVTSAKVVDDLVTSRIESQGPVRKSGDVVLKEGDDFYAEDGRELPFSNPDGNWPDLTDATIQFTAKKGTNTISASGEVITPTGISQKVIVELSKEAIGNVASEGWDYDVQATLANSHVVTLASGKLEVRKDVSAA